MKKLFCLGILASNWLCAGREYDQDYFLKKQKKILFTADEKAIAYQQAEQKLCMFEVLFLQIRTQMNLEVRNGTTALLHEEDRVPVRPDELRSLYQKFLAARRDFNKLQSDLFRIFQDSPKNKKRLHRLKDRLISDKNYYENDSRLTQ